MASSTAAHPIQNDGQPPIPGKYTVLERLRKGDEVTYLITLAAAFSILLVTGLLVLQL
jgi:hypothetical protein